MDNKSLLDQFAQLQEEQQQKFARIKQKQMTQIQDIAGKVRKCYHFYQMR